MTITLVVSGYDISVSKQEKSKLEGIGFEIPSGAHHTFLGKRNSGKSLLVKALLDLIPYDGEIRWALSEKEKTHMVRAVLQNQPLEKRLKVREICTLHKMLLKSDQPVDRLLAEFELENVKDCFAENLEKGDAKCLQIALATMSQPKVLIVDSIEEGLDGVSKQKIWAHLKRLQNQRGMTLIVMTSEMNAFVKQSDQLIVLDKGRAVMSGQSSEIIERLFQDSRKALFAPTRHFMYTKFEFPFTRNDHFLEVMYTQDEEKKLYENIIECGGEDVHFTKFTIEDALIRIIGHDLVERRM